MGIGAEKGAYLGEENGVLRFGCCCCLAGEGKEGRGGEEDRGVGDEVVHAGGWVGDSLNISLEI